MDQSVAATSPTSDTEGGKQATKRERGGDDGSPGDTATRDRDAAKLPVKKKRERVCPVCAAQKKGGCGTDRAPVRCLRRQVGGVIFEAPQESSLDCGKKSLRWIGGGGGELLGVRDFAQRLWSRVVRDTELVPHEYAATGCCSLLTLLDFATH